MRKKELIPTIAIARIEQASMAAPPLESQADSVAEADDAIHDNSSSSDLDGCVQVAVRVRPMLPKEAGNTECVDVLRDAKQKDSYNVLQLGGNSGPKFTFDQVCCVISGYIKKRQCYKWS